MELFKIFLNIHFLRLKEFSFFQKRKLSTFWLFGDSSESPKWFTMATHKCVNLFWWIFFGTFQCKVQKGHHT